MKEKLIAESLPPSDLFAVASAKTSSVPQAAAVTPSNAPVPVKKTEPASNLVTALPAKEVVLPPSAISNAAGALEGLIRALPLKSKSEEPPPEIRWPKLALSGIMNLPGQGGMAIINGKMLSEGDQIDGVALQTIASDGVTLVFGSKTNALRVGQHLP